MKQTVKLVAMVLLTVLSYNAFAQKTKTENDYNLKKAYEVASANQSDGRISESWRSRGVQVA